MAQPQTLGNKLADEVFAFRPFDVMRKIKYDQMLLKANQALNISDSVEKSLIYGVISAIHLNYFKIEEGISGLDLMLSRCRFNNWATMVAVGNAITLLAWRGQINIALDQLSKTDVKSLILDTPSLYFTTVVMAACAGRFELAKEILDGYAELAKIGENDASEAHEYLST